MNGGIADVMIAIMARRKGFGRIKNLLLVAMVDLPARRFLESLLHPDQSSWGGILSGWQFTQPSCSGGPAPGLCFSGLVVYRTPSLPPVPSRQL